MDVIPHHKDSWVVFKRVPEMFSMHHYATHNITHVEADTCGFAAIAGTSQVTGAAHWRLKLRWALYLINPYKTGLLLPFEINLVWHPSHILIGSCF